MLEELNRDVLNLMACPDHPGSMARRLVLYQLAFAQNFVPWMVDVWIRCKSPIAKKACRDNLQCEIAEDHPAMLRRYVKQAKRHEPFAGENSDVREMFSMIGHIDHLTQTSPVDGLLVMAGLENASLVFIPELRRWGEEMRFKNFEYVHKHGKADIKHAKEFAKAVEAERSAQGMSVGVLKCSPALVHVRDLLSPIFG